MIFIAILIYLGYFTLLHFYFYGWRRLPYYHPDGGEIVPISLIIPFKNEEDNLPDLLICLRRQTLPSDRHQLIFVDDHSSDASWDMVKEFIIEIPDAILLRNEGSGKKSGIATGLKKAKNQYILTLDADVQIGAQHLEVIASYLSEQKPDLLIAPVAMRSEASGLFKHFQGLEFQSLATSTAASVFWKRPIMCNGANLIFNRTKLKDDYLTIVKHNIPSGDDMFLLEHAKENKWKISYLKNEKGIAWIKPIEFLGFLKQRKRWSSKAIHYHQPDIIMTGLIVALFNLIFVLNAGMAFADSKWLLALLIVCVGKLIAEGALIITSSRFFRTKKSLPYLGFVVLFEPFYVTLTLLMTLFIRSDWKS